MRFIYILSIITLTFFSSCSKDDDGDEYRCSSGDPNIIGARCNDGTRSNATGQGACSSHGGVDYWLCS